MCDVAKIRALRNIGQIGLAFRGSALRVGRESGQQGRDTDEKDALEKAASFFTMNPRFDR